MIKTLEISKIRMEISNELGDVIGIEDIYLCWRCRWYYLSGDLSWCGSLERLREQIKLETDSIFNRGLKSTPIWL